MKTSASQLVPLIVSNPRPHENGQKEQRAPHPPDRRIALKERDPRIEITTQRNRPAHSLDLYDLLGFSGANGRFGSLEGVTKRDFGSPARQKAWSQKLKDFPEGTKLPLCARKLFSPVTKCEFGPPERNGTFAGLEPQRDRNTFSDKDRFV